jgi:release factor glutamine methyltransferase
MLLLLSSDTNIPLLRAWAQEAGFSWQQIEQKSILIEKFVIFRLHAGEAAAVTALS